MRCSTSPHFWFQFVFCDWELRVTRHIVDVTMPTHSCTKLLVFHLLSSVWCEFSLTQPPSSADTSWAVTQCTPPSPFAPSGCSPVSLSHLLPSSYSTDHACSKNRSHFHPRHNPPHTLQPPSPCTTTLLHYLLSKSKPCPQFLSKPTVSPLHCSTSNPTLTPSQCPPMVEFGGVCQQGVHQSWFLCWYKALSMYVLIRSFCQTSTPELEGATLLVEGGGPRVNTAENNKEVKERG